MPTYPSAIFLDLAPNNHGFVSRRITGAQIPFGGSEDYCPPTFVYWASTGDPAIFYTLMPTKWAYQAP